MKGFKVFVLAHEENIKINHVQIDNFVCCFANGETGGGKSFNAFALYWMKIE